MTVYIVCAWYEVGIRSYSFTVLNHIRRYLGKEYKIHVTLVLRENQDTYPELAQLADLHIDTIILKNKYLNIASKVFPSVFDRYVLKKIKEYDASLLYILYEGLFFKNIDQIKKECKVLFTVHDLIPHEKNLEGFKDRWLARTEIERRTYLTQHADYRITSSYGQLEELQTQEGSTSFYLDMPTLVNDHIADGKLIPPENLQAGYILFFGRIDRYKGLEQLIDCHLRSGISIPLVIAGSGKLWFELPVHPGIIFINRYIDEAELNHLFSHALLCVLPYESVTQTALVSIPFYFNCPVILSDLAEFNALARQSGSMIADFKNAETYKSLVLKVKDDAAFRDSIIDSQCRFYQESYDAVKFIKNLEARFSQIQHEIQP